MRLIPPAALVSVLLLTSTAHAGDSPAQWSGFHLGLTAGVARGSATSDASAFGTTPTYYWAAGDDTAVGTTARADLDWTRFTGGIEAGYVYQVGALVAGVDLGVSAFNSDASSSRSARYPSDPATSFNARSTIDTDWLVTLRPKLGFAFDRFLIEGSAGLAVTRIAVTETWQDGHGTNARASNSATKLGWTVGAALKYAVTEHWSVGADYLYTDFGDVSATGAVFNSGGGATGSTVTQSYDLQAHLVRVGVDYRF